MLDSKLPQTEAMNDPEFRNAARERLGLLNTQISKLENSRSERARTQWRAAIDETMGWIDSHDIILVQHDGSQYYYLKQTAVERRESDKNYAEMIIEDADKTVANLRENLIKRIDSLVWTLTREKEKMERGDWGFNALGIIQGSGSEIDRLCHELAAKTDDLARMKVIHMKLRRHL